MPDEPTTYLSHSATPPAKRRLSPMLAGVIGLALGAVLGAGGVLVTHTSSTTSPTGQTGNVNGQQGGFPGGAAPSGAPPSGAAGGPGGAAPNGAAPSGAAG